MRALRFGNPHVKIGPRQLSVQGHGIGAQRRKSANRERMVDREPRVQRSHLREIGVATAARPIRQSVIVLVHTGEGGRHRMARVILREERVECG